MKLDGETSGAGFRIVPELVVADAVGAAALLVGQFGFVQAGERVVRGDQVIVVAAGPVGGPVLGHGVIDHLALRALDTDAAGRAVLARGGMVDRGVTPDGPLEIAEFWGSGVRYQFFTGPDGARLELCGRRGGALAGADDLAAALGGHDHVGICCRDIAASVAFYSGLGLEVVHSVDLVRPGGVVEVRFLRRGSQMIELYSPPERRTGAMVLPAAGKWGALRFEGSGLAGERTGPDGERVLLG